ncbi:putative T7SS-secreted protein [Streptomyces collinus]|uniref:putative T7SS-secreted protein n=1 Tax=Streptomyces collinus TaxID=42684 RepID=UPI0036D086D1
MCSGLEKVGADDWADQVEDFGDERNSVLGQSGQANKLIHGNRGTIRASASHLKISARRSTRSGDGMRGLDVCLSQAAVARPRLGSP